MEVLDLESHQRICWIVGLLKITDAEFPRVLAGFDYNHYGASSMDFSVQKASFLRLSALTLAYTFPTKVINALKLTNLRVYATGSNLFLFN